MSALFSTLCLALAAFARSTKEGQYYLMPLLLVALPLVMLPMSPSVDLTLGNSLIPVTGVVLLLRSVLEGNYWQAAQFSPVVIMVTVIACVLSIRWAVEQFNRETVLFHASERLDVGLWLRPAVEPAAADALGGRRGRLRHADPRGAFLRERLGLCRSEGLDDFVRTVLTSQLAVIAAPVLLLTVLLSRNTRQTLLLKRPPWLAVPAAALLAIALHPLSNVLQSVVRQLYPDQRQRPPGPGADAGIVSPGRFLAAGAGDRRFARPLRGAGLPRLHPFGLPAPGAQVAGDPLQCRSSSA